MDRILQNTSATLRVTVAQDGTPTNPSPDSATVTVTRADGTVVKGPVGATDDGTGVFATNLDPADTALLDSLTLTWTFQMSGDTQTLVTRAEVVGGFLFGVAELQARLTDTTDTYTAGQLVDARTYAETEIERECNIAFVPRFGTARFNGDGSTGLLRVPVYGLRAVRWVNTYAAGVATALTPSELLNVEVGEGVLYGPYWARGHRNIEVGYEHGLDTPPPGAREAALVLAEQYIVQGPIDDRATQRASEFGPVNLATPGMFGSRFGIPMVDAFCSSFRIPAVA